MNDTQQKNIVITGAGSGMGRALAVALAADGARLALADIDPKGLAVTADEVRAAGAEPVVQAVDVTDEGQVEGFLAAAREKLGELDVLLNVPGLSIVGPIAEMAVADFDKVIGVNVKGTFLCSKHFLARVDAARGGLIVNFASMASKRANPNAPVYCTAKAAVAMFSQGLALQAKEQKVRVTTLCPGPTDTAFWGNRPVPREKFMRVDDVVAAVQFVLGLPDRVVVHDLSFESFEFFK